MSFYLVRKAGFQQGLLSGWNICLWRNTWSDAESVISIKFRGINVSVLLYLVTKRPKFCCSSKDTYECFCSFCCKAHKYQFVLQTNDLTERDNWMEILHTSVEVVILPFT